jgi:hypothetical protein
MTDRIDLDALDVSTDDADEREPKRGDWFWRGEGDAADERVADDHPRSGGDETGAPKREGEPEGDEVGAADRAEHDGRVSIPRVPRTNDDKPVGIPVDAGGSGGVAAGDRSASASPSESVEPSVPSESVESAEPSGPHGSGPSEMTMALTYEAARRLADLRSALADAERWTDWIGLVGDAEAHVINKFQRDNGLDLDFFNGAGTAPAERLAQIDRRSMFFAERMVVVGVDGEEEFADAAGWEFVPLSTAAAKAGWRLVDEDAGSEIGDGFEDA